jgi:tellurite resistance protein TehA-like permease
MLTVSTASLAVLATALATHTRERWLLTASLVLLVFGLALYCVVISRFDLRQLTRGMGDQWVAGGALAISTLAASRITLAAHKLHTLATITRPLHNASIVLWVLAILWLAPLVAGEAARPRAHYHLARWSTIFPLGMYAASSFTLDTLTHAPALPTLAKIWTWVALCAWATLTIGMSYCALRQLLLRSRPRLPRATRRLG